MTPTIVASEIIARFVGPVYLVVTLGVLINTAFYQKAFREFFDHPALVYVSGLLALTFGLALVIFHNVWVADWRVIVTVIGWLGLFKGIMLIVVPNGLRGLTETMLASEGRLRAGMAIAFVLGAVLTVKGFALV